MAKMPNWKKTHCWNVMRRHIFAKVHEAQQTLWIVKGMFTTNTKTVLREKFSGIVEIVEKSNVMAEPPLVVL